MLNKQTKGEIRQNIRDMMLDITDNVIEYFSHPLERSDLESDFPYISIIYANSVPNNESKKRFNMTVDIIGYVKGNEKDLPDLIDDLEDKIVQKIQSNEIQFTIEEIDSTNLFKNFGFDGGIYPPYAGVRISGIIPRVI